MKIILIKNSFLNYKEWQWKKKCAVKAWLFNLKKSQIKVKFRISKATIWVIKNKKMTMRIVKMYVNLESVADARKKKLIYLLKLYNKTF